MKIVQLKKEIDKNKYFIIMVIPAVLYYLIFQYGPMIGILIAFKDYSFTRGIIGSKWVGLMWFKDFYNSVYFYRLVRNTLLLNIYSLVFAFPVPILFALMLNEVRNKYYKSLIQTVSYFPHFIANVIIVGMMFEFLSPSGGIVNEVIKLSGGEPIAFMMNQDWFRTLYVVSQTWKSFGWKSIIFLGALTAIDPALYEASFMDGASRWKQTIYITFPSILPTIIIMLILEFGTVMMVGAEKVLLMYSPAIYEKADVISTYVYRRGILAGDYSFGTAVDTFNGLINFVIIMVVNKISKKVSETSLW